MSQLGQQPCDVWKRRTRMQHLLEMQGDLFTENRTQSGDGKTELRIN